MAVSGVNGIGVITYETKSKRTVNSAEKFIVEETDSTQEMSEAEAMVAFKKEFYDDLSKITNHSTAYKICTCGGYSLPLLPAEVNLLHRADAKLFQCNA